MRKRVLAPSCRPVSYTHLQRKVADRLVKELKDKEKKAAEEAALQALASRPDAAGSQLKSLSLIHI